ncbi:peptidase [Streptomyces lunaelactis]|uniref:peptidase n=1 Tax=Streptomyces lunaelactis TaxID=1535768 RepID=UPI00158450EF|nr:peptidase [Streptomyces lunaelactis]NUK86988.1 peptidase [Streptomyces lunaelactis]
MRRIGFAAFAVGLLAAGLAAPAAHAADLQFTLSGPAEVGLRPYPASGAPKKSTVDVTVNNPSQDEERGRFEGEYTVSFDFSGLAGIADVRFGETGGSDCTITGTTGICTDYGIRPGLNGVAELEVSAAKGSKLGATGDIKVTGTAEGATFTSHVTKVTVGGPDLVMKRLPLKADLTPGEVQPAPLSFANTGTSAADGILLTVIYSRGMELTQRYSNCEYSEGGEPFVGSWTTALCTFEGSYEAGAVYELDKPLGIRATERAYFDSFIYRVNEDSPQERTAQRGGRTYTPGSGPALTVTKKPVSARSADLDPSDNQQEFDFRTKNTADFVAYGAERIGAVGETVDALIGFRNSGPAWIGYIRSGESVATVDFRVPEGAKVTKKPAGCQALTTGGRPSGLELGAPRYSCDTRASVLDGADFALPFELKIEKAVANATGTVTVRNVQGTDPVLPFDPKTANNTAKFVLNPTDSGSDAGGTSGGEDPTGGTEPPVDDEEQTTGGTSEGPATAGGSTGGSSGGDSAQGGLAATGSGALLTAAAAAAALAAGGTLYLAARRRTTRG